MNSIEKYEQLANVYQQHFKGHGFQDHIWDTVVENKYSSLGREIALLPIESDKGIRLVDKQAGKNRYRETGMEFQSETDMDTAINVARSLSCFIFEITTEDWDDIESSAVLS